MPKCIEHNQYKGKQRYGITSYGGVTTGSHRHAYCFARGVPITHIKDAVVRHTCDNKRCINPQHLVLGTSQDNSTDMVNRGRSLRGEQHKRVVLTEDNVRYIREHVVPNCKKWGYAALGRMFGVTGEAVSYAARGKNWGHLGN